MGFQAFGSDSNGISMFVAMFLLLLALILSHVFWLFRSLLQYRTFEEYLVGQFLISLVFFIASCFVIYIV